MPRKTKAQTEIEVTQKILATETISVEMSTENLGEFYPFTKSPTTLHIFPQERRGKVVPFMVIEDTDGAAYALNGVAIECGQFSCITSITPDVSQLAVLVNYAIGLVQKHCPDKYPVLHQRKLKSSLTSMCT